mmetsp:Transcript_12871/g.22076  ORF Transcript_12871/g.22076 Transcript_12871/m.22076 type:complete len:234 (-) Transcript_12871:171-872(-)
MAYEKNTITRGTMRSLCAFRGGLFIMSDSDFSYANEMAGIMSVPKSMHKINVVDTAAGMPKITKIKNGVDSGMLDEIVYAIDFLRLSKIRRPSSIPATMDEKLSSNKIISAASLDTSEPAMPMATPIFAFFSAGESFTPSPVTATIRPRRWQFSTIMSFCCGLVRAKTIWGWAKTRSQSASSKSLSSHPGTTIALTSATSTSASGIPRILAISCAVGSVIILIIFAMALAVSG